MAKTPDIRNSVRMKATDKRIAALEAELAIARADRAALFADQKVDCPCCGKKHDVSSLVLITGMRYHQSYSSYEDSSWDPDGTSYTVCPIEAKLVEFTDQDWLKDFSSYFAKAKEGGLQLRKSYDRQTNREGKVSVMTSDRESYGYKEVLVPYEAIAKMENGRINRFPMYR